MAMDRTERAAVDFVGMIVSSIVMIILGLIYFAVTLWIVDIATAAVFEEGQLEVNWAVLSAAILATGGMLQSFKMSR